MALALLFPVAMTFRIAESTFLPMAHFGLRGLRGGFFTPCGLPFGPCFGILYLP